MPTEQRLVSSYLRKSIRSLEQAASEIDQHQEKLRPISARTPAMAAKKAPQSNE